MITIINNEPCIKVTSETFQILRVISAGSVGCGLAFLSVSNWICMSVFSLVSLLLEILLYSLHRAKRKCLTTNPIALASPSDLKPTDPEWLQDVRLYYLYATTSASSEQHYEAFKRYKESCQQKLYSHPKISELIVKAEKSAGLSTTVLATRLTEQSWLN